MKNQPKGQADHPHASAPAATDLYRLVFNHTEQPILLTDTSCRILEANASARKTIRDLLGRELEPDMSILDLFQPNRYEEIKKNFEEAFLGRASTTHTETVLGNESVYYEIHIQPFIVDGRITGALTMGKDITESRKAQKDLQVLEERWRFALDGGKQGAWDWNLRTGEVVFSGSYQKLLGFSDTECHDIDYWKTRVHPEDRPRMENALSEHLRSADPVYETKYRMLNAEGQYMWIWARGMVMGKDENGHPLRMIGTHTDITEQVHAENHYRFLFQYNPLPCWIYEAGTGKFLEVNQAATTQYGFSEAEFLAGDIFLTHPPVQYMALKTRLGREKEFSKQRFPGWLHQRKNGEIIYVDLNITSIKHNGADAKLVVSHDVTDKVNTEADLRKSNERFQLASIATHEALWEWNIETDELYLSPVYEEMFGYPATPVRKSHDWHNNVHPDEAAAVTSDFYTALNDPSVSKWQKEYRYRKADGDYIFVVDHCIIIRDEEGNPLKVVGAYQDISKRKKAEQELIRSNERFLYAAKASSEALWEWDCISGEFYASDTYTEIFGWTVNSSSFDEWHDYIHPEDSEETIRSYYASLNDPGVLYWKKEYRYRKMDGSYAHVLDKASVLRDSEGKPLRVIGAMQDITEKKEAEDYIRKSNDLFQLVNRATSDAIYDWNLSSNTVYWGEGLQTLFGFDPKTITMQAWESLVHPADRSRVMESLNGTLDNTEANFWKDEYRFSTSSGGYRYVLERAFVIRDAKGKATRLIGSMQDITDRHYQEELLSLEKSIFEMSTDPNTEFSQIIQTLLNGIEALHEDAYTSLILLKESDDTILPFVAPRLPKEFIDPLLGLQIGPGEGSCGASMYTRQMIVVDDIANDPLWTDYREHALQFNLRACWSLPIVHSAGNVMGSFAIYYKTVRKPSPTEVNTFERVTSIIRVLMENKWSLNQIKEAKERFDIMMKATHDLIWDWNLETNAVYRDEMGLQKVYGITDTTQPLDYEAWLKRIHDEDHEKVSKVIEQVMRSRDQLNFDVEYRFRRDDGSYSYVYDRGTILRNSEGKAIRMIGAAQDVTERKMLEQELLQNELEKQKAINQATVDSQEAERGEIGKELHDNVNQVLTTTKLYLDLALSSQELKDDLIRKSSRNVINVINEIRQLSRSLMDPSIGDLGLIDSIHDLVENINLTRKLHVKLTTDKKIESLLDKNHKLTVFRIIQEALNNAIRHAQATTVCIRFTSKKQLVEVVIEDNGVGFDPVTVKKGAGLKNIQNRIYLINGTHHIDAAPGKGCRIMLSFPINKQTLETIE